MLAKAVQHTLTSCAPLLKGFRRERFTVKFAQSGRQLHDRFVIGFNSGMYDIYSIKPYCFIFWCSNANLNRSDKEEFAVLENKDTNVYVL